MAVDIRIEQFAIDLFRQFWKVVGFESNILKRSKEYGEETNYDITTSVIHAVGCRYYFFMGYLSDFCLEKYDQYSKNGIDFYYFIHKNVRTIFWTFDHLNIFDRLFLTSAFIAKLCENCLTKNSLYRYIGPLCCAMYFETEFKDEFYDAGGWEELRKYAKNYDFELLKLKYLSSIPSGDFYDYFYNLLKLDYHFDKVIHHFKQRSPFEKDWSCCFKCLPLQNILYTWSYSLKPHSYTNNIFCVEGLLQLFIRMLSSEEISAITNKIPEDEIQSEKESDSSVMVTKAPSSENSVADIKDITAEGLCKRLFADLNSSNSEELKHTQNHRHCIFCHINLNKTPDKFCNPRVDSGKVYEVKNFIRQTVSESKSYETVKRVTFVDESVSSDETKTLRLFSIIGMKPAMKRMLANSKKEVGSTNDEDLQKVTHLRKTLDIESDFNENASKVEKEKKKKE